VGMGGEVRGGRERGRSDNGMCGSRLCLFISRTPSTHGREKEKSKKRSGVEEIKGGHRAVPNRGEVGTRSSYFLRGPLAGLRLTCSWMSSKMSMCDVTSFRVLSTSPCSFLS
jgi:hypothetical protein